MIIALHVCACISIQWERCFTNTHILCGAIKFPPLIDLCPLAQPEPYDIAVSLYDATVPESQEAACVWERDERTTFDVPLPPSLPPICYNQRPLQQPTPH